MKKLLYIVPLLLGMALTSCYDEDIEKINSRLDAIENTQIATISQQITSINNSILLLNGTDKELKEYITALEKKAKELEAKLGETNTKIDTVKSELTETISTKKADVLAELEAFRATVNGELEAINAVLETLKAKDAELEEQIADLKEYVDSELTATEDWATATFATLEQYNTVVSTIATIEGAIKGLNESISALETRINEKITKDIEAACATLSTDLQKAIEEITEECATAIATATEEITAAYTAKLESAISALETSMKKWINEQLTGYYTVAEIDAKLAVLEKICNNNEVKEEIEDLRIEWAEAIRKITENYKSAINKAINNNNGVIDAKIATEIATINEKIAGLENRLNSLEDRVGNLEELVDELVNQKLEIIFDEIGEIGITAGGYCEVGYTIVSSESEVHIATIAQNGWKATITKTTPKSGHITVYAPNPLTTEPILVFVSDTNTTIMRTLTFVDGITTIATKHYSTTADATTLTVGVQTNMNYKVVIPQSAQSWISVQSITTRAALRNDSINLSIAENTTTTSRTATLQLVCNEVEVGTITIYQLGTEVANNEIVYTTTDGKPITLYQTMGFNANVISHTYSKEKGLLVFDRDITSVSEYAFYKCSTLKSVQMPNSIKQIREYAFYGCSSLINITIPDSVTKIGNYAFYGCYSLKSIIIGSGVTSIGERAFYDCTSLTSVVIPDSITVIGERAFEHCISLTSITIGNGVTSIGSSAFYNCSSLTSVTIGSGVTSIGERAFYDCTSLTSVVIPDSVTSIGNYAFYDCTSLTSVYCKATTPPTGGNDMFNSGYALIGCTIYVPTESVDAYKTAPYWSNYKSYISPYDYSDFVDPEGGEEGGDDPIVPEIPFVSEASELGVVGSFAASGWANDAVLYTTPTEGLLVAEGVELIANDAFRIRTVGSWKEGDVNIGAGAVNHIQANKYFTASDASGVGDIIVEAAGTYDIYFNVNTLVVYLMTAGADIAEATEQTENVLYFAPHANWKTDGARFAAYFFGDGDAWVSMTDSDADGIYEVNIPVGGYTSVIFCRMSPYTTANNWNNKWNQTADLAIPTDGNNLYTLTGGEWNGVTGAWSSK